MRDCLLIYHAALPASADAHAWRRHPYLSRDERNRLAGFKHPERRRQFIFSRLLLRHVLQTVYALPPAAAELGYTAAGKPYLPSRDDLQISLSHSHARVACGISLHGALGLDIEKIDPTRDWRALAERICAPAERLDLQSCDPATAPERFFRYWTLKEAVRKTTLEYFAQTPAALAFDLRQTNARAWRSPLETSPALPLLDWYSAAIETGDYVLAIATETQRFTQAPQIWEIDFSALAI